MKNVKMSAKISLVIIVVLAILLTGLTAITSIKTNNSMNDTAKMRFREAAQARSVVIDEYFKKIDMYMSVFANSQPVKLGLEHADSESETAVAQDYTSQYVQGMEGAEGLFVNTPETLQIAHSVPQAVGAYGIDKEENPTGYENMQNLLQKMWDSGEGEYRGIVVSPTTGTQVVVYYYPVFDDQGNGIGYVGLGLSTDYLLNILGSMDFAGLENAYLSIIQTTDYNYVTCGYDETLTATECTDANEIAMVDEAVAGVTTTESGDVAVHPDSKEFVLNGKKVMEAYELIPDYNLLVVVGDTQSEITAEAGQVTMISIIFSIVAALIMAVLTFVFVRMMVRDLTKVSGIVSGIAESMVLTDAKKLDKYADRGDEVGTVSKATLQLCKTIGDAVEALQKRGRELKETAENLADIANQTLSNVGQVESAVSEIADGATSQATETEKASGSVVEMGNQIIDAASAAESIITTSDTMKEASRSVTEVIDKLVAIGEQTSQAIDEIYEQTNTTNNSAVKIKQATEIITGIAEETNLLSLNASIEAARAGEQGKGFAVVASQIQKLAEQSSQSAQQIEAVIAALIEDSDKAVATMEEVKKIMVQQSEYVKETGEIFGQVREGIDQTVSGINEISNRTSQMDSSRQSVVDVVENLSAIAEENAASTEETSASVTIVNDLMGDISQAANNVSQISEDIDRDLSAFKL